MKRRRATPRPGRNSNGPAALALVDVPLDRLEAAAYNPRRISERALDGLTAELREFGLVENLIANDRGDGGKLVLVGGHQRVKAARRLGWKSVPVHVVRLDQERERALNLALNNPNLQGEWDPIALAGVVSVLRDTPKLLELSGYSEVQVAEILALLNPAAAPGPGLELRFGVPPFSVLDARQGYWQERKRAWMSLGIESELGRGEKLLEFVHAARAQDRYAHPESSRGLTYKTASVADPGFYEAKREAERRLGRSISTREFREKFWTPGASYQSSSIFDPVLCELVVRWFCPPGGQVYDPFAGGSVRGLVAGWLGRRYVGLDLSPAQLAANDAQAERIFTVTSAPSPSLLRALPSMASPETPTPVERSGELWLKRDDALLVAGVRGGKVRTCWRLAQGATGLVTAGSRSSPQVNIVAHVAKALGIPCRVHVPAGARTPELEAAAATGAEVLGHRPGRNSVICARARADAEERGWKLIPFGMECREAVEETAAQVVRVDGVRRIVVPVGSGMTLAGVLHGLDRIGWDVPVLGVLVGADPTARLGTYAPAWWKDERRLQLKRASTSYDEAARADVDGVVLDPHYEAKCVPFLEAGDLLWIVGIRETAEPRATAAGSRVRPRWIEADALSYDTTASLGEQDLVFTCPPYGDLERYSDDPRDLSNMKPQAFDAAYAEAVRRACSALAEDRFAVYVVGDYRDSSGSYRNLPGKTIAAFEAAGLRLYNEAILVTAVGSLPVRTARFFEQSRKLGKSHQNVLVFVKGDATRATAAIGPVDFGRELEGPPAAPAAEAM